MTDRELLIECLLKIGSMQKTIDGFNGLNNEINKIDIRVTKIETEHKVRGSINSLIAGFIASMLTLIVKYLIDK